MLCSAAWSDFTIDLGSSTIQYCCKGPLMPLDIDNINNNEYILDVRDALSNGVRHANCNDCWTSYDEVGHAYRDFKNLWKSNDDINHSIKFYQIKLDNICNMRCTYCVPTSSHLIAKEENIVTNYKVPSKEDYYKVINFLKEHGDDETTLCFIGGELTHSPYFYEFMDVLLEVYTKPNLRVSIMTNGNYTGARRQQFLDLLERMPDDWKVFVAVSNESCGRQSELIRWGLEWDTFAKNIEELFFNPNVYKIINCPTTNVFSVSGTYDYFKWLLGIAERANKEVCVTGNSINTGPFTIKNASSSQSVKDALALVIEKSQWIANYDPTVEWFEDVIDVIENSTPNPMAVDILIDELVSKKQSEELYELKNYI